MGWNGKDGKKKHTKFDLSKRCFLGGDGDLFQRSETGGVEVLLIGGK